MGASWLAWVVSPRGGARGAKERLSACALHVRAASWDGRSRYVPTGRFAGGRADGVGSERQVRSVPHLDKEEKKKKKKEHSYGCLISLCGSPPTFNYLPTFLPTTTTISPHLTPPPSHARMHTSQPHPHTHTPRAARALIRSPARTQPPRTAHPSPGVAHRHPCAHAELVSQCGSPASRPADCML